ncbi:SIMPL domain-containing protein [bacterium]|nr:SIMPL domain-containing protein [bacterium]
MRKFYLTLALCLLLFSYNQTANASLVETKKDAGYVSLNASKYIEVEPNTARVTFAIENTAETAQKASSDNNTTSNQIINALKKITNTKTDVITTTNFSVSPIYATNKDGKRIIKNYSATNSVTVKTSSIENVSSLIDLAIKNGANRIDGLYFSYENENTACNEMYPQLMDSLTKQAAILAKAAGTSLDGIKSIGASCSVESNVSNGRFYISKAAGNLDSVAIEEASTPVESGKVKVRIYINANFYVK